MGRICLDSGDREKAEKIFGYVLKRDPLNAEAAYALGRYGIMSGISTAEARIAADWLMTEGRYSYAFGFLSKYTEISGKTGCMTELYLAYAAKMSGDSYADRIASAEKALDASAPAFARTLRDREVLRALGDENSFVVPYRRGNLEYDAGNADVAEEQWRKATAAAPERYEAYRNLALCSFNKKHDPGSALGYMEKAFGLSSGDPRVLSELCGLYRAVGKDSAFIRALLEKYPRSVLERDDLYAEYCSVLADTGEVGRDYELLTSRNFHPWEGGEGKVTGLYKRVNVALAARCAAGGDFVGATERLRACLTFPRNLGEGKLALDLDNDVHYLMGTYYEKLGRGEEARTSFEAATRGDLRVADMNYYNDNPVEYVFYAALAFGKLGNRDKEKEIKDSLLRYCAEHADDRAEIDYFAVSLPDMLVWDQDIAAKNRAFTDKVKALAAALEEDLCSRADRRHRDKDRRGSERVDRAQIRHAVTRVRISGTLPTRRRREIRRLDSVEERSRGQTALCLTDG